jgi:hypothetical protein
MLLDILVFLDDKLVATGNPTNKRTPPDDRLLRMTMEQVLFQGHELEDYVFNIPHDVGPGTIQRCKGWYWFSYQAKHVIWAETVVWEGRKMKCFDHLLTHNIRNFLHAWDLESPTCSAILHNLESDEKPYDESAVRRMVEGFLDSL